MNVEVRIFYWYSRLPLRMRVFWQCYRKIILLKSRTATNIWISIFWNSSVIFFASNTFILSNFSIPLNYVFFKALEAWCLVLAAWSLNKNAASFFVINRSWMDRKNFSQLRTYAAGSSSRGRIKYQLKSLCLILISTIQFLSGSHKHHPSWI